MTSKRWWIALVVLAMIAAACGGTTSGEGGDTDTTGAEPAATTEATEAPTESTPETTGGETDAGGDFKAAFVYVAPIGDLGWTWAHDQGRIALEEELGIETAFIENVPEGPDAERVIRDFAQKGYNVVFTTSFGYMDPTINVASEFPDTQFVHISGFKTAANASNVFGAMEEARYLSGMVAGAATESNVLGFVAAFPIPEVIRGINAFTLGARSVNPDATVKVVWTNTWFGPPQEKEAAEALLAAGADVIAQHQDTTEPQKAAADAGKFSIGYDSDMRSFVGDSVLTSPVWDWAPKYISIVEELQAGTYQGDESWYGSMADGVVDIAELSPLVDAETKELVEMKRQEIIDGSFQPFCGPVLGANGAEIVAEGKCLTLGELLSMDYFVEGVEGEAPNEAPTGLGS
ncbi:MAG: BMP family ABC transporter substrate-binding protein [Acidimicrobiia bacterium]|nr:BMP family ABC transporter substrate-binding protein [Acidimicrobiia bacterium]MDH4307301.1 BMP family ABC transporter substrate-binding protein [Acidimicrobiia bacterium]MDH5294547.1 BMP family ABC transporter substrate-binding protein [Acidimicrobiia bacterium]